MIKEKLDTIWLIQIYSDRFIDFTKPYEIIDIKIKSNKINIINGGRYDNLIGDLGSNKKIPAVGAAINLND